MLAPEFALAADGYLRLTLHGDPGEFISQGRDYDLTYIAGISAVLTAGGVPNGPALTVEFSADMIGTQFEPLDAKFSTAHLHLPLAPGTYDNAQRADFAGNGHPGMDVTFESRGNNKLSGSFTIYSIVQHVEGTTHVLDSFNLSFIQYNEAGPKACWGTITYNAVPEPTSALCLSGGLALLWRRRARARWTETKVVADAPASPTVCDS